VKTEKPSSSRNAWTNSTGGTGSGLARGRLTTLKSSNGRQEESLAETRKHPTLSKVKARPGSSEPPSSTRERLQRGTGLTGKSIEKRERKRFLKSAYSRGKDKEMQARRNLPGNESYSGENELGRRTTDKGRGRNGCEQKTKSLKNKPRTAGRSIKNPKS